MIINIQNVLRTSQLSTEILAGIARTGDYTAQLDSNYYCDKTVRGVCVCKLSMIPDSCEIDSICIEEGFRRKGLGKKLLAHSLRNMRSQHIKTAYVWVNDGDAEAVEFFTAFGFKPDGKRHSGGSRFKIDIY